MEQADHILTRDNRNAHITVSAWIMDRDRKKVLMAYHNLYQSWAWLGGHADGDADLKAVALKEIREESGLESVRFVTEDIFSLEILTVDGHEKREMCIRDSIGCGPGPGWEPAEPGSGGRSQ